MIIKTDCKHFKGDVPCEPHKKYGVHCGDCSHYSQVRKRILIIKCTGLGDVIRTTPIVRKIKEVHPDSEITWLTLFPEVLPGVVDNILLFSSMSTLIVMGLL